MMMKKSWPLALATLSLLMWFSPPLVAAQSCTKDSRLIVKALYNQVLKRDTDESGLSFWSADLSEGRRSPKETTRGLALSKEFNIRFIQATYVNALYRQLLGRNPDAPGFNVWATALAKGKTVREAVREMANSPEFGLNTSDAEFIKRL